MADVTLRAASVTYGAVAALAPTDLHVAEGSIHVLLGASGSGKTSLLRLVAGFERAAAGRVAIGGRCVDDAAARGSYVPPERRGVGVVFQDYALFPHLSALGNVAFGLPRGRRTEAAAWIERVGLGHAADRLPSELSGGEQQRVAVARALAPGPGLVLLDEPFSNLDPARRTELRRATRALLKAAGVTALLVTHTAEEAFELGDTASVLRAGRVLQSGPPAALYATPADEAVATALGDALWIDGEPARGGDAVTTALGTLRLRGDARARRVLVRPEQLVVGSAGGVEARVVGRRSCGAAVEWSLVVGDGVALTARTSSFDEAPVGDVVRVWVRGDVCCVPAQP